jgi:hypothetical protein
MKSMGTEFFWFQGVVEDRNDPLKLGRVRVRILGIHSEKNVSDLQTGEGIPTDALPWAYPINSIQSASMNGIGETPLGPVEGTWIVGFSRDGRACQNLFYFGTLGGIPQEEPKNEGFNDPNKVYPKKDFIGEPDTNRLARNENIDKTIVKKKKDGLDKDVPTANGKKWTELTTAYSAVYPFNHVFESESGHIIEIDDTKNAERIHQYHKSGTFEEIHPDGSRVLKVVKDDYEITIGDKNVHIKGVCNITIDGDSNLYVKGNVTELVDGNVDSHVKGNVNQRVDGNVTETVLGNVTRNVSGTYTVTSGGNMKFVAPRIDLNP